MSKSVPQLFRNAFWLIALAMFLSAASAQAMSITYDMTLNASSSGSVTLDTVAETVTAFELNTLVPINPCCGPPATPPLALTITLADFNVGDGPEAVFFGGQFAGLDFTGSGSVGIVDFMLDLQVVAIDAGSIDLTMAGPGQLTAQDTVTTYIYDVTNYSQSYELVDDDVIIPEPTSAYLFGAGLLLVLHRRLGHG